MRHSFGPVAAAALVAGAGLCLLLPALPPWPWLALLVCLGVRGWWHGRRWRVLGPLLLGFGLAGLHAAVGLQAQLPPAMEGEDIVLNGTVAGLPEVEPRRTRFLLRVAGDAPPALRGKRLQVAWYDPYGSDAPGPRLALHAGEQWRLRVRLQAPRGLRNPGGFDAERHALVSRIAARATVRAPETAQRLAGGGGIDAWRERLSDRIKSQVQVSSSRFVRALALGDTSGLSDADWTVLRATGLTHLIAISGFHVGLAAGLFVWLARGLWWAWPSLARGCPRTIGVGVVAVAGAWGYTAVAGFALPTVRTALMIAVVVVARLWRRPHRAVDALALAAIVIVGLDPLSLLAPGFWLSFAGVAWLLWCLPTGAGHPVRGFLGAQGVASLALLPLTVVLFGQASLAGPLANLVAVPWWSLVVVPLALLGTALEGVHAGAGEAFWRLSALAFDLSWPWFERLAAAPIALWWLPESRWYALPMALAGAFWLLLPRGVPGKPLACLLWLPLLCPPRALPAPGEAELVVVDVGQGLSVLVRTARHAMLYDMGPATAQGFDAGERAVVPALHAVGVRRLNLGVVSHADNDHAGGLAAVQAAFPMRRLLGAPDDPLPATGACVAGTRWQWDGVLFRVLHPTPHFPYMGNESSCVLRVETVHGSVLLAGDIGDVVEHRLLRASAAALRADVVLVPHHGSKGSSSQAFVTATQARVAVVSSGHGNRFGHPKPEVVARWAAAGARVVDTADSGAIRLRLGRKGLFVSERRLAQPRLWDAVRRGLSYRPN